MNKALLIIFSIAVIFSCGKREYSSARIYNIVDDNWRLQDTVKHEMSVDDTTALYELSLYTATLSEEIKEFDVELHIDNNGVRVACDTVKVILDNRLDGNLIVNQRSVIDLTLDSLKFDVDGDYLFSFRPLKQVPISCFGVLIKKKNNI